MKLEDAGRALDCEIEKLRIFLKKEIRPETRMEMAKLLRQASVQLTKLADRVDKAKS